MLLGVGGDAQGEPAKWLELLESSTSRISFINSVYDLIKTYDFDGLDLAFEFPKTKPKKIRSSAGELKCSQFSSMISLSQSLFIARFRLVFIPEDDWSCWKPSRRQVR